METLVDRYSDSIKGVVSCYDRILVKGTLSGLGYADGMTKYLYAKGIRIFGYPAWANGLREKLRGNAESIAKEHGVEIEFVGDSRRRKENIVAKVLEERGTEPGLVHIISAMESCSAYKPWHDGRTGTTYVKYAEGKCVHYYFYFIDEVLGLCYMRVPTWCPFRLQFYFNGHNALASQLADEGIEFKMIDNAFVAIEDFVRAQEIADDFDIRKLQERLDQYARMCCPILDELETNCRWSIAQVEYATDIVFSQQSDLEPLYEELIRTAVTAVKADNVAMFLGRKVHPQFAGDLGTDFSTRIQGTRIKHRMGPVSIKMYDKHGLVLRIETTCNDVSVFKHRRKVECRDGTSKFKLAPVRKSIYSLHALRSIFGACNRRYLEFISALEDPTAGVKALAKISETRAEQGRRYRGFNFFSVKDLALFVALLRGEHTTSGFRNRDLRERLPDFSGGQISRLLKRLRVHGLIKRVRNSYKYYPTALGKLAVALGLKLMSMFVQPQLARGILASP